MRWPLVHQPQEIALQKSVGNNARFRDFGEGRSSQRSISKGSTGKSVKPADNNLHLDLYIGQNAAERLL